MRRIPLIVALLIATVFVILGIYIYSIRGALSGPICAVDHSGRQTRLLVDADETGDYLCIRWGEPIPAGYKDFPGGAPQYFNDPQWRDYFFKK